MHGRRGHWDPRFEIGDPFLGLGGSRGHQSSVPGIFGGHDPFDHPFFTDPFGGLSGSHPFGFPGGGLSLNTPRTGFLMGGSPFMLAPPPHFPIGGSPFMHAHLPGFHIGGHPVMNAHPPNFHIGETAFLNAPLSFGFGTEIPALNVQPSGFLERNTLQPNRSKGPIIEELNSDDEKEIDDQEEKNDNPRKHDRPEKEAYVEDQDYQTEGVNKRRMLFHNESNSVNNAQSIAQGHSFTFHSSTVTHGGSNGAYYTKSRTLRRGTDGLVIDESKEADSTTGQAAHRLTRGIHDKGHTFTRNLQSDGKVDTMQILHNLEKDDLAGFEQTWTNNARKSLPGWSQGYMQNGSGSSTQCIPQSRVVRALPSVENPHISGGSGRSSYLEFQNPGMNVKNGDGGDSLWGRF